MENQKSAAINKTEKWTSLPSMKTPRKWFGATAIGDKIYVAGGRNNVAGGQNSNDEYLSSAEVYDSTSRKWWTLSNMKKNHWGCGVTTINGKIYIIGGYDGRRKVACCEMFDPATNKWTAIPDMKEARSFCTACSIFDKLCVIGGHNDDDRTVS